MMRALALLGLLALVLQCQAHEVHTATRLETATVVTLTYANGKPFAFEQFEVTPTGADLPSQVGRTDARGRASVLPVPGKALEFTATAKDGHGARLTLPPATESVAANTVAPSRWLLVVGGSGFIFGLFGLVQLFYNRNRRSVK
jgi:nickel transport protein